MKGFSKAIIAGNLTRDPETRTTPGGASVTSFTIAVNRSFKDASGSNRESTSFLDCVAWAKGGELIAQYCKKGSGLLVSGRIEQRSWEDKDTKQKRSKVEVVVEDFSFLGSGSDSGSGNSSNYSSNEYSQSSPSDNGSQDVAPDNVDEPIDLSEIPF
jgi:single-strand DNA-binding protein